MGPRRCERVISTLRQYGHKRLVAPGIGSAAAPCCADEVSGSSCIAIVRARRTFIRNAQEVQQQSSEDAQHKNGEANNQDDRNEYLKEEERRINGIGKFSEQDCAWEKHG
jgi:hypothetical protein